MQLTGLVTEGSSSLLTAEGASSWGIGSSSSSSRSVLVEGSSKGLGMRRPHLRPCLMGRTGVRASLLEMYLVAETSSSSSSDTCKDATYYVTICAEERTCQLHRIERQNVSVIGTVSEMTTGCCSRIHK